MQPSRMVYSYQPCPAQLEHRASLLLFCLTRFTNHPDIPNSSFLQLQAAEHMCQLDAHQYPLWSLI